MDEGTLLFQLDMLLVPGSAHWLTHSVYIYIPVQGIRTHMNKAGLAPGGRH